MALATICITQLVESIDVTVVNVALPAIKSLGFSTGGLLWGRDGPRGGPAAMVSLSERPRAADALAQQRHRGSGPDQRAEKPGVAPATGVLHARAGMPKRLGLRARRPSGSD